MSIHNPYSSGWKDAQGRPPRRRRWRALVRNISGRPIAVACGLIILVLIVTASPWISAYFRVDPEPPQQEMDASRGQRDDAVSPTALSRILRDVRLSDIHPESRFELTAGDAQLNVMSFIDADLQQYVERLLHRSRTLRAAVVVMNPLDGRILALAGYDGRSASPTSLCTRAEFPAASLFKLVSAAAALEVAGFTPERAVSFRGRKYTLYKSQLTAENSRYSTRTTFRRAFAGSINSVFGKMGIYDLGREVLQTYAERFLFNREIPFDFPVEESFIRVPEDDFGLAEIASGFNKKTRISPLHAVLLVSSVANNGIMMRPRLIAEVSSSTETEVYRSRPKPLAAPVHRGTAEDLRALMGDTVRYGTGRSAFRPLRRKNRFRDVDLGAKTGTINDESDQVKFDWLAAYALPENGAKSLCVAVLGVHGNILGVRAGELGRHIIDYYLSS